MSFNVTNVSNYTKKATLLLGESVLFSEDYAKYNKAMGIPYKQSVKFAESTQTLQAGGCKLNPVGGTNFTEKDFEAIYFGTKVEYCVSDLLHKGMEEIDVMGKVLDGATEDLKAQLDQLFWLGDTGSGDLMDGLATKFEADATVLNANFTSAITSTNIDDAIKAMYLKAPKAIRKHGIVIHMSYDFLDLYKFNRADASLVLDSLSEIENASNNYKVYGLPNVFIRAEVGLEGSDTMYATYDANIYRIYDETENVSALKLKADPIDENLFYLISDFRFGVDYGLGSEVVKLK